MASASLDQNAMTRVGPKEEKLNFLPKSSPIIKQENEHNSKVVPKGKDINLTNAPKDINLTVPPKEHGYGAADNVHDDKRIKLQRENDNTTLEKLKSFFEIVQKQHPESQLELQYVDGSWKVWCGVCKKLLRPDKSGKAIHNIQRQHFSSSRHKKKLHLMLQAEEAAAEAQKKHAIERGDEMHKIEHRAEKN